MLTKLVLENFRGFESHEIPLKPLTVIVGQNNAGKSTIVEALRLLSIIVEKYKNLTYRNPPDWLEIPRAHVGVSASLRSIEINFDTLFHRYQQPPAIVTAHFRGKGGVKLYISGQDRIHAVITNANKRIIKSRAEARQLDLPPICIMPQVAPLNFEETILNPDYVRASISSRLSPQHFRNQLNLRPDLLERFQQMVESTWHGVRVVELMGQGGNSGDPLYLQIRNDDFVAEASLLGHGLQMWLQTMWFLTHTDLSGIVILDEPDVYMHADLQRRLIRLIRDRYPQVLLTTHSIEIMSEVASEEILVVDKRKPVSSFADSLENMQKFIDNIGSIHNIHLARLWHSRRFILVEGDDLKLLKPIQNTLFPRSPLPIDSIPNMSIRGWGGWNRAIGSSQALQNAMGENITVYCILDCDYHSENEKEQRKREAEQHSIELHIWKRKEIENYLLHPTAIRRLISKKIALRTELPTEDEIKSELVKAAAEMEARATDSLAEEIFLKDRALGLSNANRKARDVVSAIKCSPDGLLNFVSGKELVSKLADWVHSQFGVSISAVALARELTKEEIPDELNNIVNAIETGHPFDR